jgi:hypothetical protein
MPDNTDNSDKAFLELVRVLEEAVRAGANSIGLEYEGRELIVFHNFGNTGLGAARIPQELQQDMLAEMGKRAGLSRKSKGKMQVRLVDKDYEAVVEEYDSFGESAFTITGKAMIYITTGITEHEWELAKSTTTAHLLVLLCRAGIGQRTDPKRCSVLSEPAWRDEWQRIVSLDGEQAHAEVEAGCRAGGN